MNSIDIVVTRYIRLLEGMGYCSGQCDDYFHRSHLLWMLYQILEDTQQSFSKKHRWLGYVQGVLCFTEVLDVDEEREFTRDIFKGE